MLLLAESGSTKVEWAIVREDGGYKNLITKGINPHFQTSKEIIAALKEQLLPFLKSEIPNELIFYGAGVATPNFAQLLYDIFITLFPGCKIEVNSDLLAAARAVCGHSAGLVGILGTGSNSCFWDGSKIAQNTPAGGYILGDEGSGAYFGKRIIGDWIKGVMPTHLSERLKERYSLTYEKVVQKVYREPFPNRYLASLSPFLEENRNEPYIKELLYEGFSQFIKRNFYNYPYRKHSINFVGSIAYIFQNEIIEILNRDSLEIGVIVKSPMDALVKFHSNKL